MFNGIIIITTLFLMNIFLINKTFAAENSYSDKFDFESEVSSILTTITYEEKIQKLKFLYETSQKNNQNLENKALILYKEINTLENEVSVKKNLLNKIEQIQLQRNKYIETEIALKELYAFFILKQKNSDINCKNISHKIYFSYDSASNKEKNIYRDLSIKLALDICAHQQLGSNKP